MLPRRIRYGTMFVFSPYTLDFVVLEAPPRVLMGKDGEWLVRRDAAVRAARKKQKPLERKQMGKKQAK